MPSTSVLFLLLTLTPDAAREEALTEVERSLPNGAYVAHIDLQALNARGRRATALHLVSPPEHGQARFCATTVGASGRQVPLQWLRARVEVCGQVWVASRALPPGRPLSREDLRRELRCGVEVSALEAELEPLLGGTARRRIGQQDVVMASDFAKPPLVRARQLVAVVVRRGGLLVRTQGVALENASLGQSVRVRLPERKTSLAGVAVSSQRVEVLP